MTDNLPSVSQMLKDSSIGAKKKFGQHFLFDLNITDKIAKSIPNLEETNIIEIGPGPAGLSRSLLNCGAKSLISIETDEDMLPILEKLKNNYGDRFSYLKADALKLDKNFYTSIPAPRGICANLPYNIGTELLINWLHHISDFDSLTLMFQKEVADRILASAGDKAYGRLAILREATATAEKLFDLAPTCFTPQPKIWSSVILIRPKKNPLQGEELYKLENLTAKLFNNRRKMIRAILKDIENLEEKLKKSDILPTSRPETIPLESLIKLSNLL